MDDPTVRGIILDVDSPGGEVGGLFALLGSPINAAIACVWTMSTDSSMPASVAGSSISIKAKRDAGTPPEAKTGQELANPGKAKGGDTGARRPKGLRKNPAPALSAATPAR